MRIKISKSGGSFKNSPNFESEEELKEKLDLDDVEHYDLMVKVLNKGHEIYAIIDPYNEEIDCSRDLKWERTPEKIKIQYTNSLEDI